MPIIKMMLQIMKLLNLKLPGEFKFDMSKNNKLIEITNHFLEILNKFGLGKIIQKSTRVYGGLLHKMWKVETDEGFYAIKQLFHNIDLTKKNIIENYELTELTASRFLDLGISVQPALENNGHFLSIIHGNGYLIYPWINGKTFNENFVSEHYALKISNILSKIHQTNLDVKGIQDYSFQKLENEKFLELINESVNLKIDFSHELLKNKEILIEINNNVQKFMPCLNKNIVISHCDLDQKNVIWKEDKTPVIIDWESAGRINSTFDLIKTCFYWSGITADYFDQRLFFKMIETYEKSGGIIHKNDIEPSLYASFDWIQWLVYNIEKSCTETEFEQKKLGIEQVNKTLQTILRLSSVIPDLLKIFKKRDFSQ